ncbi:helix-turn-helix domain-containing protein [Shewanella sp. 125m-1]
MRRLTVALFMEGNSRTEVALRLRVVRACVNAWVAKYLANGVKGLDAKKNKGRDSYLTAAQKQQLNGYIEEQCISSSGGRTRSTNLSSRTLMWITILMRFRSCWNN